MKTLAFMVWFGLAGAASFALFNVTFKVEKLEADLGELNRQILADQQSIHVLKAEWSYLDRPERLETLIEDHLPDLKSGIASPTVGIDQLPKRDAAELYLPGQAFRPARLNAADEIQK